MKRTLVFLIVVTIVLAAILSPILAQQAQGQGGYPGPATNTPIPGQPTWTPTKTSTPGVLPTNTKVCDNSNCTPTPTRTVTVTRTPTPFRTATPMPGWTWPRLWMPVLSKNR